MRQIVLRVGDVTLEVQTRIQGLSAEQLDDWGEALLDFRSKEDLIAWLESAAGCTDELKREWEICNADLVKFPISAFI
ncbi:DUF4351 domain-containing protein [Microcoleus sp. B3-D7]|uniref:DUF4351 domain-containing protein n=1 Tax=Microcoleus sp. B3-D7 TaxID=2818659 RepID=UPI002FD1B496